MFGYEKPVFKKMKYVETASGSNKKRMWKSLKQILATERTLQWHPKAITCEYSDYLVIWILT